MTSPFVLAHGLVQRADLPIPEWLFTWAAMVVLVVSFVALAVLWREPRFDGEGAERWRPLPGGAVLGSRGVDLTAQAVGLTLLVVIVAGGFAGVDEPQANLTPTFVFVVFWVGLVFVSILLGDIFRALNPWRALGRLLRLRGVRPYPERLGRWPAALGLFGFTWLELAYGGGEQADVIAAAAVVYTAFQLLGMAWYGVDAWIDRAEAFSVYFGLFARMSLLRVRDGVLGARVPLTGLASLTVLPGTLAVVAVMIGTVTYDGLSSGKLWRDVSSSVGLGDRVEATLGMLLCVALVLGFYELGVRGARSVGGGFSAERLAHAFVHSLVPIAVVYVAAHYLTLLVYQGQAVGYLVSDPLGKGWDLFGTASFAVDYGVLSQNATWYLQVLFVVGGHVAALALAHDRALALYDDVRLATRSQYWMLAVMVGFTTLALWLLAQAGA